MKVKNIFVSVAAVVSAMTLSLGIAGFTAKADTTDIALDSFKMTAGAEIRKENPVGIRFTTEISAADYEKLPEGAVFGTLVIPTDLLDGELTLDTAKAKNIPTSVWAADGETKKYTGVIVGADGGNFAAENYKRALTARGYVTFNDGEEKTIYASDAVSRSIAYVATAAVANGETGDVLTEICSAVTDNLAFGTVEDLAVGETRKVALPGAEGLYVTYGTDDGEVISVEDGVVTALKAGTAKLTASVGGKTVETDVTVDEHLLLNGGFETGDTTGWTEVLAEEGLSLGIVTDINDVNEDWAKPFNKQGEYVYSFTVGDSDNRENRKGTLTSSEFKVGGSGFVSMWWASRNQRGDEPFELYLEVLEGDTVIGKYYNLESVTSQCAMQKVMIDLSAHIGKTVKLRFTDNSVKNYGGLVIDDIVTLNAEKPADAVLLENALYQVMNGGFETGNLTGWTTEYVFKENPIIEREFWGMSERDLPYNSKGMFFDSWTGQQKEEDGYTLKSANFVLGGSGFISFRMAGHAAHVNVYKADGTRIARYDNTQFADVNFGQVDNGCRLATMITFLADLHEYVGETLYIVLEDEPGGGWGISVFDEVVTYYETAPVLAECKDTVRIYQGGVPGTELSDYDLPWVEAVNTVVSE